MALLIGGESFPLATGTGAVVQPYADQFLYRALDFYQWSLNNYLATSYQNALAGQVTVSSNAACVTTMGVDPEPWLDSFTPQRPPLLSIFPMRAEFKRKTTEKDNTIWHYGVRYVLPAMAFEQYSRLAPVLQAAWNLLVLVTEKRGDPAYTPQGSSAGTNPWTLCGVQELWWENAEFGFLAGREQGHFMPSFFSSLMVVREDAWDASAATSFTYAMVSTTVGDNTGLEPSPLVQAETDVGLASPKGIHDDRAAIPRRRRGRRLRRTRHAIRAAPRVHRQALGRGREALRPRRRTGVSPHDRGRARDASLLVRRRVPRGRARVRRRGHRRRARAAVRCSRSRSVPCGQVRPAAREGGLRPWALSTSR